MPQGAKAKKLSLWPGNPEYPDLFKKQQLISTL
jgi:hypothetical protein